MFQLSFSKAYSSQSEVDSLVEKLEKKESITLQTSGSTGIPKQLVYDSKKMIISAKKTNRFFDLQPTTCALLALPISTIAGKMMVARAFSGNYSLLVIPPSSRPLQDRNEKIDFVAMVPLQLEESLKHDLHKLKSIPTILIGGGPIPEKLKSQLIVHQIDVFHSFGMTETVSHVALKRIGHNNDPYFKALPGIYFSEQKGQLVINATDLGINALKTNDLVVLKSDTEFEWLGRKDFVVNSGGFKIHPELLENTWSTLVDLPFFLWKEPHIRFGEQLVVHFEGENWPNIDYQKLKNRFQPHEIPKKYYLHQSFSYTESGKIKRKETIKHNSTTVREKTF